MLASPAQSEIEATYIETAGRLEALVARNITAPAHLVEEACQIAWLSLVSSATAIPGSSRFGWLATTAMRETLRLVRAQARELSLDDASDCGRVVDLPARSAPPDRLAEMREQLAEVHQLPVRQQRMVWLQGFGYDYGEIAARTGDSHRTVERQLRRARQRLALVRHEDATASAPRPARS
jgi:RNA polymerase sigma factor (sigma-70 family)